MWAGQECYIIGGGDSLRGFDFERLRGRRIIAINAAYRFAPWADVLFFGDTHFLARHGTHLDQFGGIVVSSSRDHHNTPGVLTLSKRNTEGISADPLIFNWNRSSGGCAIDLAVRFGVRKITLLGYDMQLSPDGRNNFHDHYPPRKPNKKHNPYGRFVLPYPRLARDLERLGIVCVNAVGVPESRIDAFRKVKLEDVC